MGRPGKTNQQQVSRYTAIGTTKAGKKAQISQESKLYVVFLEFKADREVSKTINEQISRYGKWVSAKVDRERS